MSKRSLQLDGAVTSISMEQAFWLELDRYAHERNMGWAEVVRQWLAHVPQPENRSASVKEMVLYALRHEIDMLHKDRVAPWARWKVVVANAVAPELVDTYSTRLVVGREMPAELILADDEVSRRHALLVNDGQAWWILDLNSKNGTYIDGKKVQSCQLAKGRSFSVGKSQVTLMT